MKYKLAIFDLDGTILDTLDDLANSTNAALCEYSLPPRTNDEVRAFVGNGIRLLIERAVPKNTNSDTVDKVFSYFKQHYAVHCFDNTRPYDGINNLLDTLRNAGCKTAVVSNKADFAVVELCKKYFDGKFDFAVGERENVKKKPCPDSVYESAKALNMSLSDAVYIGDSDVDILTAKNAGIPCISVTWGFRDPEFLKSSGATTIVNSPAEIKNMIL